MSFGRDLVELVDCTVCDGIRVQISTNGTDINKTLLFDLASAERY